MKSNIREILPESVPCPSRPAGQRDVLELSAQPLPVVHVGFIGLGEAWASGRYALVPYSSHANRVDMRSQCRQCEKAALTVMTDNGREPSCVDSSAEALCQRADVDLVYICTDWESHADLACCAPSSWQARGSGGTAAMTIQGPLETRGFGRTAAAPLHDARKYLLRLF